jgi:hypothetical protein
MSYIGSVERTIDLDQKEDTELVLKGVASCSVLEERILLGAYLRIVSISFFSHTVVSSSGYSQLSLR